MTVIDAGDSDILNAWWYKPFNIIIKIQILLADFGNENITLGLKNRFFFTLHRIFLLLSKNKIYY